MKKSLQDSASVYSLNPKKPFKYGHALKTKDCEALYAEFKKDIRFRNGDVIADIGGASGWLCGVLSVYADSVSFYIQDIDTNNLNETEMKNMVKYYSGLRSTPQTNHFTCVMGTETKTNLPNSTFDLIIINNSYHEITHPWEILSDLKRKLKPGGRLVIIEQFSGAFVRFEIQGCGIEARPMEELLNYASEAGLCLQGMMCPEQAQENLVTFTNDSIAGAAYQKLKERADWYLSPTYGFLETAVSYDSVNCSFMTLRLKERMDTIMMAYPLVEGLLETIYQNQIEHKHYRSLKNLGYMYTSLRPGSSGGYEILGFAYELDKNYALSLANYQKALELEPESTELKQQVEYLQKKLKKK